MAHSTQSNVLAAYLRLVRHFPVLQIQLSPLEDYTSLQRLLAFSVLNTFCILGIHETLDHELENQQGTDMPQFLVK